MATVTGFLDHRQADPVAPLFVGQLLAQGRRTVAAWFRAGGITDEFRRGSVLLGAIGRSLTEVFASLLFRGLRRDLDPGPHWLFALDDTPTERCGLAIGSVHRRGRRADVQPAASGAK